MSNVPMRNLLLALAVVFPVIAAPGNSQSVGRKLEIAFCPDMVSLAVQQANWTETLSYSVQTDSKGIIVGVTRLRHTRFPDDAIVRCMKRWTLPLHSAPTFVTWRWQHGQGWTSLSIGQLGDPWKLTLNPPGHW